jgi:hypothetical protein
MRGVAVVTALAAPVLGVGDASGATSRSIVLAVAHRPVTAADTQYVDAPPAGPSAATCGRTTAADEAGRRGRDRLPDGDVDDDGRGQAGRGHGAGDGEPRLRRRRQRLRPDRPTIAKQSVAVRPVIGGSGKYAGARGWCVSTHHADGAWTHVFHLTLDR